MDITPIHQELRYLSTLPFHCFVQLGVAVLCGAIIGFERELKRKAAGLRTNVLICMGATIYMILSQLLLSQSGNGDVTRIAGQVVVGMGFIGAGTIIQSRGRVVGLTSAATLWVAAAIGVVIGAGYPLLGLLITLFVTFLLVVVGKLEFFFLGKCQNTIIHIAFRDNPKTWEALHNLFSGFNKKMESCHCKKENGICFMDIDYCHIHPDHKEFFIDLMQIPDIRPATAHI
ncbi:MAG: MgtC/SapB family protein [Deltaproteobacteria bacterium]|nr:MgtC/SapB family protein [Deltaproteobacteria bacterium]